MEIKFYSRHLKNNIRAENIKIINFKGFCTNSIIKTSFHLLIKFIAILKFIYSDKKPDKLLVKKFAIDQVQALN